MAEKQDYLDSLFEFAGKGLGLYTQYEEAKAARDDKKTAATVENVQQVGAVPKSATAYNPALTMQPQQPQLSLMGYVQSFSPVQWAMMAGAVVGGIALIKAVK